MATVRERAPGVWEVRVFTGRDDSGRPTRVSRTVHGTKKDAQRLAAELTLKPSQAAGRTVGELLDAWLELNEPGWAPGTARDQRSRAKLVKADPIGKMPLARVTVADVDHWHIQLRRSGVGDAAIRNRYSVLRAALAQAVRWEWVSTNVAATARLARRKRPPRESMSAAEVRAVLDAALGVGPGAALALRLAAVTGARRAELAALRWDDLKDKRLRVDSSVAVLRGPSSAGRPVLVDDTTKTTNARTVTLDDSTVGMWHAYRASFADPGDWVFALFAPANPDRIGWWWKRARERSGIDRKWRLHDLRHWSATEAIGSGHDIRTVAGRLGHADPAMTLRVYAHVLDRAEEQVAASLASALDE
jgi:integrase